MNVSKQEEVLEHQSTLYFRSVQRNRVDEVKEVVKAVKTQEFEINVANTFILKKSADTALNVCARNGYIELTRYLVEEVGANLEQINLDGKTALHDAAQFSQEEIVKYLLAKGANVNVVKRADWTPLMLACTKHNVGIVKALVNAGADLNFVNKDGWTCIHIAAREGNVEILSYLLEPLKDITRRNLKEKKSRNGRKPIHTAVMHGHLDAVKLLAVGSSPEELNEYDNCGTTPLLDACRFGFLDIAEFFIEVVGISPHLTNKNGIGILHVAAESNQVNTIEFLVKQYKLDINTPSICPCLTPLQWASREGNLSAVEVLLNLGANLNAKDSKGRSAADIAFEFKKNDIYNYLSKHNIQ